MLRTLTISVALALLASAAIAQTAPVSTPSPSAADPTADQIASWIAGRHGAVQGVDDAAPPQRDGRVHGEFGASIGSGGYKSAYGVATMPIGQKGDVTVGIGDEHLGGGNRTYGPGYGYGGYGGDRRSLSIGVDLTGQGQAQRCNTAAPGTRWGPSFGAEAACPDRAPASQPER